MTIKVFNESNRVARMQKKEKDGSDRPLSRHGHWRPRLYRGLSL